MRLIYGIVAMTLALSVSACAGKRKTTYEGNATTKNVATGPAVVGSVVWLKNKKDRIDVLLRITNEYPHPVLFRFSAAKMSLGGVNVAPTDADLFELGAGITSERVMIFKFGENKAMTGVAELELVPQKDGKDLPPLKMALTLEEK